MIIDYFIMCIIFIIGTLFTGFIFGLKKPIDTNSYFQAMFNGYRNSKLRWLWKTIIFSFEYIIGIIILFFINVAFYPADTIRNIIKWLFVTPEEPKEDLSKYADKTNRADNKKRIN